MKRAMALSLAAMLGASAAMAANLDAGTQELSLSGLLDFDSWVGTELVLDVGYGYFIADNVEVGGLLGFQDNDVFTLWTLGGMAELNIPVEGAPVVPFVGAKLLIGGSDIEGFGSTSAVILTVSGGAKFFITEDLAVAGQLNLSGATDDIYANDGKAEDTDVNLTLGLRYYFD